MVYDTIQSSKNKKRVSFASTENEPRSHARLKSPAARSTTSQETSQSKRKHETDATSNENRRSKHNVKKCFVRDAEVPVTSSSKNVRTGFTAHRPPTRHGSILKNHVHPDNAICDSLDLQGYTSKYSAPELYSSLSVAHKIKLASEEHNQQFSVTVVPPLIKHQIEAKASCKNNVPFEEQIYRDLVTLSVCEEEVLCKDPEKFVPEDQEPCLADYHHLRSGEEYRHESKPLPCNVEKVRRYNGFSVYNKMQHWENNA